MSAEQPVSDRRELRSWYLYDWAASAFSTTVLAVFLGPYLTEVTRAAAGPEGFVYPLGLPMRAESFYPYVVSASVLLQVFLLPLTGVVADRSGRKKQLLGGLAYAGALATMGLYFLRGENYLLGGGLFLVANMALGASFVVYNAFLIEIAAPEHRDRVSARGWAVGYLGGGLLLAANLVLFVRHDALGLEEPAAVRISLLSAGLWWGLFALVSVAGLRNRAPRLPLDRASPVGGSVRQLRETLSEARAYPQTLWFLAAYLLYNDGVQSVIALSATYGAEELELSQTVLIGSILMVQFVAFAGALLLGAFARVYGAKRIILASLGVWSALLTMAYFLQRGAAWQFFALAFGIGLVLGGTQALSRSLFSQLVPPGRSAQYFGLYELGERGTAWTGPLAFGLALQLTGSYRAAIASLLVFFVAGFVLLARVDVRRGIRATGN